jgi:hypothetical protein
LSVRWAHSISVLVVWACFAPDFAFAEQNIGAAAAAHNNVTRELSGNSAKLVVGEAVFRDEAVKTGVESTAKLVFLDSTALAVGPISRVVLDKFVYDPSSSLQSMAVDLTKGVFRFTTGALDKRAYTITTPTATVGVRGTVLDIKVEERRSRVTLVEGGALVCPRRKGETFASQARACGWGGTAAPRGNKCECVELDQPGQTASVVAQSGATTATLTDDAVQFASLCASDPALCSGAQTQLASSTPLTPGWGANALCGR